MISQYQIGPLSPAGETSRQWDGPIAGFRVIPVAIGPLSAELAARLPSVRVNDGTPRLVLAAERQIAPVDRPLDKLVVSVPAGVALVEIADTPGDAAELPIQNLPPPVPDPTIYSGSGTGTALDTGTLDLRGLTELTIHVDNTAGGAFRDLTFQPLNAAGAVIAPAMLLRKVGFGAAPTGSAYAPGSVRGYVGPNPPGGTAGVHTLFEATSAADGALDTGLLNTEDQDAVYWTAKTSGGTTTVAQRTIADSGANITFLTTGAAANQLGAAGAGCTAPGYTASGVLGGPPHRRMQFLTTTAGAGNTVTLVVMGRGRTPGTFAHQRVLPPKARIILATGAAAASMTIVGR